MKKLNKYVYGLIEYYKYYQDISKPHIPNDIESQIMYYISDNYKNITKQKYVLVYYDKFRDTLITTLSDEFKKELCIHYPERLI